MKYAAIRIFPRLFLDSVLLVKGGRFRILESPVPIGARFIRAYDNESSGDIFIIIEHESFDDVGEGFSIPILNTPIVIKRLYGPRKKSRKEA